MNINFHKMAESFEKAANSCAENV